MTPPTPVHRGFAHRAFWVLWAIAMVTALVIVAFFFIGLSDGSVSSFNIVLWLSTLFVLGSTLLGSYTLHASGSNGWAIGVVLIVALPGLLFGLFFLVVLLSNPTWN
mgnify:CR=1 FL=1